jgi:tungstate transport system permease protein
VDFLLEGIQEALQRIASGDPESYHAAWVSILCSSVAVGCAALLAVPYGAWLAVRRPFGHRVQVMLLRVGMFVPTVFIGVLVYGILSRRGPLGALDLVYTRRAIMIGEFLLAFPILGTLTHGAIAGLDPRAKETAQTLGASPMRTLFTLMGDARVVLLGAGLTAFARCFTELGIALSVGGNIRWHSRTLSTTMSLELSRGDFGSALAPGFLLILLAVPIAVLAHYLSREDRT